MMKLQPSSSSSSSKTHTHQHLAALKAETNIDTRKQRQKGTEEKSSGHPFRDLNYHITRGIGSDLYISSSSSMSSIEAPKGCLRFCLSHSSSSSTSNKTPSNVSSSRTSNSSRRRPNKVKTFPSSKVPSLKPPSSSKENSSKRPTSGKPISQKCLYQRKKPILKNDPSAARESGSGELKYLGVVDNAINLTPSSKRATRSASKTAVCSDTKSINSLDFNNDASEKSKTYSFETISESSGNTMTPPIEASVSPEIQFGFSKLSAATTTTETTTITPPRYGAGHLLSGTADKRKCRARGLLVVGEAKPLANFDSGDDHGTKRGGVAVGVEEDSPASLLPLPIAASMHWHLSPCREQGEECQGNSEDVSSDFRRLEYGTKFSSPASDYNYSGLPSHLFDNSTAFVSTSCGNISKKERRKACLISPYELTETQGVLGSALLDNLGVSPSGVGKKSFPDLNGDASPFSIDSFGSGNVMQTPHSNSSSDTQIAMPSLSEDGNKQKCNFDADLDVLTEHLQQASVSPKRDVPLLDQARPSFQFDCLITPSGSVDLSWFQKVLDDDASRFSGSTMDTVPQSHLRISWREGLASRMFEMDEFDCFICLSDEEEDSKGLNNGCLESHCSHQLIAHDPFSTNGFFSHEVAVAERGVHGKTEERIPSKVTCCCAESISTDGGGLICSDDSDWALCYKNQLFLE